LKCWDFELVFNPRQGKAVSLCLSSYVETAMKKDRRDHSRVTMHALVNILRGNQTIEAEMENLSINGTFVRGAKRMEVNDNVVLSVCSTSIKTEAKVVRVTDTGMGLRFAGSILDAPER
jgi:hypothetical protein